MASNEYSDLQRRLASGWNTWNTRSVLSHVLLPEGFALNLCLKEYAERAYLKEALIGRVGQREEQIRPGPHAYDGSYTDLHLSWRGVEVRIESAADGEDLVLLVTPKANQRKPAVLVVEGGILWNRSGTVCRDGHALFARLPGRTISAFGTEKAALDDPYVATQTPYLAMELDSTVGLSTGRRRTVGEIRALMARRRREHRTRADRFGELAEVYAAIQTILAWDTVYEPEKGRVVTPVSRIWSVDWGGYVLFDWDTYFAALMASVDNRDLAYANAVEMTREKTDRGFVPNFAAASGYTSRDRSQPPVGALTFRELYRRFGDRWVLDEVFDALLSWNRWWIERRSCDGLLCWGSDPYEPLFDSRFETEGVNEWQGAAWESGLDNSPMYDDVPFNRETHRMELADVGLASLYVVDCDALADIAEVLGRATEETELRERAAQVRCAVGNLWHEAKGIFRNRRTDTGDFSPRISPTCFYPLLARAATRSQVARMTSEHFYNSEEFWGAWMLPSITRDDPAYGEQDYWRGRIWPPMNYLVYLGLREFGLPAAQASLAEKSKALLLKEWRELGHIHENYSADTGEGCDRANSDAFYHWGGLLGLIALMEAGYLESPETPLDDVSLSSSRVD
jgi:hypothetical protein